MGMGMVVYSVTAVLPSAEIAGQYARWLVEGHVQAVIQGGARTANVTAWDGEGAVWKVEAVYEFEDRGALDRYMREFAPGLRAEGLARWGGVEGIRFERRVGDRVVV
ncbi:MAG: DUF4286 family protein [Phycisphaerales bacterium]|nr:DUF4286 family protein [Phycisphaerales bacterium]